MGILMGYVSLPEGKWIPRVVLLQHWFSPAKTEDHELLFGNAFGLSDCSWLINLFDQNDGFTSP